MSALARIADLGRTSGYVGEAPSTDIAPTSVFPSHASPLHAPNIDHDNAFSKTGFQYEIRGERNTVLGRCRYRHREQAMMVYLRSPLERMANSDRIGMQLISFAIAIVFIWIGAIKFAPYKADSVAPFVADSPFLSFFYNIPNNDRKPGSYFKADAADHGVILNHLQAGVVDLQASGGHQCG